MEMLVKGYKAFKLRKEGNPADYCEDDWDVKESDEMLRCAVTDGATDSFFSGFWASLLASSYCAGDMSVENFNASIDELQAIWLERVEKMKLPWYAEEKSKSGAFAAIVGLTVHYRASDRSSRDRSSSEGIETNGSESCGSESHGSECHGSDSHGSDSYRSVSNEFVSSGSEFHGNESSVSESNGCAAAEQNPRRWEAFALGDCCLFQYRKGKLLHSLPLTASAEFNSCPYLISSREENNKDISKLFVRREGTWEAGDQFLLMSDAIACWLLQQEERNEAPLLELESIRDDEEFREWIAELRSTKGENGRPLLKNDDVTIFHLSLPEEVL